MFRAEQKQLNMDSDSLKTSSIDHMHGSSITTVDDVMIASNGELDAGKAGVLIGSNPTATLQKQIPELKDHHDKRQG